MQERQQSDGDAIERRQQRLPQQPTGPQRVNDIDDIDHIIDPLEEEGEGLVRNIAGLSAGGPQVESGASSSADASARHDGAGPAGAHLRRR